LLDKEAPGEEEDEVGTDVVEAGVVVVGATAGEATADEDEGAMVAAGTTLLDEAGAGVIVAGPAVAAGSRHFGIVVVGGPTIEVGEREMVTVEKKWYCLGSL
jgi:hypothetical protein